MTHKISCHESLRTSLTQNRFIFAPETKKLFGEHIEDPI